MLRANYLQSNLMTMVTTKGWGKYGLQARFAFIQVFMGPPYQ